MSEDRRPLAERLSEVRDTLDGILGPEVTMHGPIANLRVDAFPSRTFDLPGFRALLDRHAPEWKDEVLNLVPLRLARQLPDDPGPYDGFQEAGS